ncbi:MAG: hypothetical protein PHW04_05615 [Candidatus Wallbacteria bacterium]|nr:hypothetical protein [Candidatus Wallbacteria bacterium]
MEFFERINIFAKEIEKRKEFLDRNRLESCCGKDIDDQKEQQEYHSFIADSRLLADVNRELKENHPSEKRNILLAARESITDSMFYKNGELLKLTNEYQENLGGKKYNYNNEELSFNQLFGKIYTTEDPEQRNGIYHALYGNDDRILTPALGMIKKRTELARKFGFIDYSEIFRAGIEENEIHRLLDSKTRKLAERLIPVKNNLGLQSRGSLSFCDWEFTKNRKAIKLDKFREKIDDPVKLVLEFYASIGYGDCLDRVRVQVEDIPTCGMFFTLDPPVILIGKKAQNMMQLSALVHEFGHAVEYLHRTGDNLLVSTDPFFGIKEGLAIFFERLFYSKENLLKLGFSEDDISCYHLFKDSFIVNFDAFVLNNARTELKIYADGVIAPDEISKYHAKNFENITGVKISENTWLYDFVLNTQPGYGYWYTIGSLFSDNLFDYLQNNNESLISPETGRIISEKILKHGGLKNWKEKFWCSGPVPI